MAFKFTRIASLLVILSLGLLAPLSASAQGGYRANVEYIENGLFPQLEAYVSVTDVQGFPVKNLTRADFAISEDNQTIPDFEVSPVQNIKQPLAITLVIDTSGSMGVKPAPTALMNAVEAAKAFVDSLSAQDLVAVVRFSDAPAVVLDFTANKDAVKTSLDSLTAGGETTLYDGIVEGVGLLKNRDERRILVLLTDGKDTGDGQFKFKEAMDEAGRWAVPIYPIGFGEVDRLELEQMAALTGGFAQVKPNASDLQSAFSQVLQVLREQYLIRYNSQLQADGLEHTFKVTVNSQAVHAEDTHTFIALPGQIQLALPFQTGDVIGGTVLLRPEVLGPAPVAKLEIQLDGQPLQIILAEPFEYAWNSTTVAAGPHDFKFIVTDKAGNTAETSVQLEIQSPITVAILAPASDQQVGDSLDAALDIQALDGIARVEFAIDNPSVPENILATLTTPPFDKTSLDLSGLATGQHQLIVTATDVNGFSSTAQVVFIKGGDYWWMIAVALVIGLIAILIPVGLRQRKSKVVASPASGATGGGILREEAGLNPGQMWPLGQREIRLGRKRDENDIPLKGLSASRHHATVRYEQGQYVMYSANPQNPLVVNNAQMQTRVLQRGDVIRLGETVLRYE